MLLSVPLSGLGNSPTSWGSYNGTDANIGNPPASFNISRARLPAIRWRRPASVWMVAYDLTAGKAWLGLNGVWFSSGVPSTGAVPMASWIAPVLGTTLFPAITGQNTDQGPWTLQSTAASQKYAPPAGLSAWESAAPTVTGHRYWRLNITATQGPYPALAEVQFRTTAGAPLLFSGGTAIASSDFGAGYTADLAADNNPSTMWLTTTVLPQTWGYDYGAGKALAVVELTLQARDDANFATTPSTFMPQWSDDGANWTSMAQITAATWTAASQIQTFAVTP